MTEQEMRIDWHQTKGLSITIIALLLANIISTVWWAASITKDVDDIKGRPLLTERVIRIEVLVKANTKYLNRLANVLDKVDTNMDRIDKEQVARSSVINRTRSHLNKGIK